MSNRRTFFKTVTAAGLAAQTQVQAQAPSPARPGEAADAAAPAPRIRYPRVYSGRQLAMLAFPLGGIGTGSISLGGRGQLRDWEIFNRPDKGRQPAFAFASIWAKRGSRKPVARVLEARLAPPYAASSGLRGNAPGLSRLESATFTGEFPMARIAFRDARLPVEVKLEAFSPFIPLDADASGYPAAVLRYRVRNPGAETASVSIAFALENPIGPNPQAEGKRIEFRRDSDRDGTALQGYVMTNPALGEKDPGRGSIALSLLDAGDGKITHFRWPLVKWFAGAMLYWDDFSEDGQLGPEESPPSNVAALCLNREIAGGAEATYTFALTWHFPNRTPAGSGWTAPKEHENDVIGNYYCTRFGDAWVAAQQLREKLPELEKRTRSFVEAMRASTLPAAVRDAAMANLSTLVTQTCFRTADGEFHGFEGSHDQRGCCFGNCTHVWNYETSTQYLFPSLARSLRRAAFGFSEDEQGGMRFRQKLPDGFDRFGYTAADGQMGQIIKACLDWKQCGDTDWLRGHWPAIKRALSYAWIPNGWDPERTGVMHGVQHNTYDVEFFGPNPLGTIYYLGGLRAGEEMARALGDTAAADEYRALFEKGREWIDRNLFNGEYYIQRVKGVAKSQIAPTTTGDMGSSDTEKPAFQLGEGCLADQLIGQYLADLAGLGPLTNPMHLRKTLESIRKYNYRANLFEHDSVQRIYALNDEPALLICDYGKVSRPRIPFPYYAEAWTGIEYLVAAQFIQAGMLREGLETIENVRRRFDGERRNPWDEPECGHHYARAMSAWSSVVAFSGVRYDGAVKSLRLKPKPGVLNFASFFSTGLGWGTFSIKRAANAALIEIAVTEGALPLHTLVVAAPGGRPSSVGLSGRHIAHQVRSQGGELTIELAEAISLSNGAVLMVEV